MIDRDGDDLGKVGRGFGDGLMKMSKRFGDEKIEEWIESTYRHRRCSLAVEGNRQTAHRRAQIQRNAPKLYIIACI